MSEAKFLEVFLIQHFSGAVVLAKEPFSPAGILRKPTSEYIVSPTKTLEVLLGIHFPSCVGVN